MTREEFIQRCAIAAVRGGAVRCAIELDSIERLANDVAKVAPFDGTLEHQDLLEKRGKADAARRFKRYGGG